MQPLARNFLRRAVLCGFAGLCGLGGGGAFANAAFAKSADQTPINIVAAQLDYFDKQQKMIYTGDVVATRGDTILKTPRLTVFLAPKAGGTNAPKTSSSDRVRRMEAVGPVTLISKDQVATGDSGIYQKGENKVYLDGNVRLTQGPNVTLGDHIVYDLKTTQAVVTGHVRSLFIPDSDNSTSSTDTTDPAKPKPKRLHRAGVHRPESAEQ
ncbi:MAG: LptA/OstA family protein [Methylovirgula sp.]|uniref:LptA/OstA family protein n=1 Tax=Methylovirgula sp. TaxID=1978224 RepID=UPI0030767CEE